MIKLFHYLDKIGADYTSETYGSRYFYNVEPVIFPGAAVSFEHLDRTSKETERKIKRYCRRYGYTFLRTWNNLYSYGFVIVTKEDCKAYDTYRKYQDEAGAEWEQMQHEYLTTGRSAEINEAGRDIMKKHEDRYIQEINRKTA